MADLQIGIRSAGGAIDPILVIKKKNCKHSQNSYGRVTPEMISWSLQEK